MSKIVITTAGSLGDLHPYLAIALGLRQRGHDVVFATSPCYQNKVESLGLSYHAVRPDSDWLSDPEKVRRLSHPRWGFIRVGREWLMPALRDSYADTLAAAKGADLLVAMLASYATRLVAEKTAIPWVSAVHIPLGFFSTNDPPVLDFAPMISKSFHALGPNFWGPLFWCLKRTSRFLAKPWYQLRSELGLPTTTEGNPFTDSQSPFLVLALFSQMLAAKQADWPPQTIVTGFPFYDGTDQDDLPASLAKFLDDGPPPIVFTLGSAVSMNPGQFYNHSLTAAKRLGRRVVLVLGRGDQRQFQSLPADAIAVEYAPFGKLFPKAAVIVHHGGVGTTGLAMRAGRPMLVVPNAWDQPDNAERVRRLGIACVIRKSQYTPGRVTAALGHLLSFSSYSQRASQVGENLQKEDGTTVACDAIENLLLNSPREHQLRN